MLTEEIEIGTYERMDQDDKSQKGQAEVFYFNRLGHTFKHGLNALYRSWLKEIGVICVLGFILARAEILGELAPFGVAFYAVALKKYRKYALGLMLSIGLGMLSAGRFDSGWSYMILLITMGMMAMPFLAQLENRLYYGMAIASVHLIFKGILGLGHTLTLYHFVSIALESILVLVFTMIFFKAFFVIENKSKKWQLTSEEELAIGILFMIVLIGLPSFKVGQFDLKVMLMKLIILLFAAKGGAGIGASVGVMVGLIDGISSIFTGLMINLYAFSGLIAGVFKDYGKWAVGVGFLLGQTILSYMMGQQGNMIYSAGETILALLIMQMIPERYMNWFDKYAQEGKSNSEAAAVRESNLLSQKLMDFSQVFVELANIFKQTGKEETPPGAEDNNVTMMINTIAGRVCKDCTYYSLCWEKRFYKTYSQMFDLFSLVEELGHLTESDIPEEIASRCGKTKDLALHISYLYELYKLNYYWQKKICEGREIVSGELKGISHIISDLSSQLYQPKQDRDGLEELLIDKVRGSGIEIEQVRINDLEDDHLEIAMMKKACNGCHECEKVITTLVSEVLDKRFVVDPHRCALKNGKNHCGFKLYSMPPYTVTTGIAKSARLGNFVSGDNYRISKFKNDKFAMILSDGMGVGPKAAVESNDTISMLEQLMKVGYNREFAVQTINSLLILRSPEETFATVDLAVIDLHTAKAEFIKIGSSPCFIKNDQEINVLKSTTLPIGILNQIEVEPVSKDLKPGDILIMVTDGILDAPKEVEDKEGWMVTLLEDINTNDPQMMANTILQKAREAGHDDDLDDMTILVARVDDEYLGH